MSTEYAAIVVSLMSLVGVMFTAWMGHKTQREAVEIGKSVNHRPAGAPRLYDLVLENSVSVMKIDGRVDLLEDKVNAHVAEASPPAHYPERKS